MFLEFTGRRSFATPTCVFCDILSPSFSTHILAYFILNYKLFQGLIQNSFFILYDSMVYLNYCIPINKQGAIIMKRITWIDISRAIGMLAIIIAHSLNSYTGNYFSNILFAVNVPIFFVLSGYLHKDKSYSKIITGEIGRAHV